MGTHHIFESDFDCLTDSVLTLKMFRRLPVLSVRRAGTDLARWANPAGVYVNNQVDLKSCEIFGFDYDYTLAEYKLAAQKFIFDRAKEKLYKNFGFPEYDQLADKGQMYVQQCAELMQERQKIKRALKAAFRSPFGSIFRSDLTKTHYARQMERYAELYTSSINNFENISLDRTFFPPRVSLGFDHRILQL